MYLKDSRWPPPSINLGTGKDELALWTTRDLKAGEVFPYAGWSSLRKPANNPNVFQSEVDVPWKGKKRPVMVVGDPRCSFYSVFKL